MYRYFSQKAVGERKQKKEEEREKERDSTANVDEVEPSERDFAEMNFARLVQLQFIIFDSSWYNVVYYFLSV